MEGFVGSEGQRVTKDISDPIIPHGDYTHGRPLAFFETHGFLKGVFVVGARDPFNVGEIQSRSLRINFYFGFGVRNLL